MLLDFLIMVMEAETLTATYRLPRPDKKVLKTEHDTIWEMAEKVDNMIAIGFSFFRGYLPPRPI